MEGPREGPKSLSFSSNQLTFAGFFEAGGVGTLLNPGYAWADYEIGGGGYRGSVVEPNLEASSTGNFGSASAF